MTDPEHWVYGLDHTRALFFTIAQAAAAGAILWLVLRRLLPAASIYVGFVGNRHWMKWWWEGTTSPACMRPLRTAFSFLSRMQYGFQPAGGRQLEGFYLSPPPPAPPLSSTLPLQAEELVGMRVLPMSKHIYSTFTLRNWRNDHSGGL